MVRVRDEFKGFLVDEFPSCQRLKPPLRNGAGSVDGSRELAGNRPDCISIVREVHGQHQRLLERSRLGDAPKSSLKRRDDIA